MNPFGVIAAAKVGKYVADEVGKASQSGFSDDDVFLEPDPAPVETPEPASVAEESSGVKVRVSAGYRDNVLVVEPETPSGHRGRAMAVLAGLGTGGSALAWAGSSALAVGSMPLLLAGVLAMALGVASLVWAWRL